MEGGGGGVRAGCSELRVGRSVLRRFRDVRDGFQTFYHVLSRFITFSDVLSRFQTFSACFCSLFSLLHSAVQRWVCRDGMEFLERDFCVCSWS